MFGAEARQRGSWPTRARPRDPRSGVKGARAGERDRYQRNPAAGRARAGCAGVVCTWALRLVDVHLFGVATGARLPELFRIERVRAAKVAVVLGRFAALAPC